MLAVHSEAHCRYVDNAPPFQPTVPAKHGRYPASPRRRLRQCPPTFEEAKLLGQTGRTGMNFEIHPKIGAGPLKFGMGSKDVRAAFGDHCRTFKRTSDSPGVVDHYAEFGLFVGYDASGTVEALEFDSSAKISIDGMLLQNSDAGSIKLMLKILDVPFSQDESAVLAKDIGVAFWVPDIHSDERASVESIIVFRDGYW